MIVIEDKDFKMVQSSKTGPFFDLYFPHIVNEGKDNERTEMKISGHGHTFEYCMNTIINLRLASKVDTCSISEYFKLYAVVLKEIEKLIKHVEKVKEEEIDE